MRRAPEGWRGIPNFAIVGASFAILAPARSRRLPRQNRVPPTGALGQLTAAHWGLADVEESAPISVIGTGPDLNSATDNGLERAAALVDMSVPEVKNRAAITGATEIGRHPGVVRVTFRAPMDALERCGLASYAREQYGTN